MASLGKDIASIRQKKGLSLEEVQKSTRIPQHILRSIEDDTIFEQINDNTTYTRSYVRSYAKALGISETDIVRALDQVEADNYDGQLAEAADAPPDSEQAGETDDTNNNEEPKSEGSPEISADSEQPEGKSPAKISADTTEDSASVSSMNWVDIGRKTNPAQGRSTVWSGLLIILLVIGVLAAVFLLYNYYNSEPANEPAQNQTPETFEPRAPSDSLRESLTARENRPPSPANNPEESGTLADTLSIAIYAATGNLEPVRVYTDILGQRNPYWVSQGDTIRFNFVNTVRLRAVNQYDRIQLLFNGHIIQDYFQQFYNTESDMVELQRTVFEDDPKWQKRAN